MNWGVNKPIKFIFILADLSILPHCTFCYPLFYLTALVKRIQDILIGILNHKILPIPTEPEDCDFGFCSTADWFFLFWLTLKVVPYSKLLWWWQEKFLFQRAALVVCVHWLVPCCSHQWCIWVLYHALRTALRQGELHQVADLHGHLLLGKPFYHTALKGKILRNTATGQY